MGVDRKIVVVLGLLAAVAACGPRHSTIRPGAEVRFQQVDWPALDQWSQTNDAPRDVAVIVAIEDYAFLPDIAGAGRNASDWEAWFASRGMQDVFVLRDAGAASEEMLRFADVAAKAARPDARLWYVFIGHGAPATDGSDGVLVGMDARQTPDSLTSRGVRQQELVARLAQGEQAETILVVDACFSGQSTDGAALAPGVQPVIPVKATIRATKPTVVLTAAQSDQFAGSLPSADRPAYSYLLLGALRGWAADGSGRVTARAAHDYVTRQLRHVPGRTQTPDLAGEDAIVLTAAGRETDPGIAERMRQAAAGPIAADAGDSGVRVDTGAGVVVTQLDGWTPHPPEGGLLAFENPRPNQGIFYLFGWKDPDGRAQAWINDFHDQYQKTERQIRPTQAVRYGDVSTFETSYLANVDGHEVTAHIWDIQRPGAFYRAIGLSFDSDQNGYGSSDYADFQRFVKLIRFGSAANALRLRDGEPGVLDKLSTPPPDAVEQAELPALPAGFKAVSRAGDERPELVFLATAPGVSLHVLKIVFDSPAAAREDQTKPWGVEGTLAAGPTAVTWGANSGEIVEYHMTGGRYSMAFTRTSGRTTWLFIMYIDPDQRSAQLPNFREYVAGTRFFYP